jgi:hypothetical protein
MSETVTKKDGKKVPLKSRDNWELGGNRLASIKVVDLVTGETAETRAIFDAGKNEFRVECRRCGKWGVYSLDSITEDEQNSGLCPKCFNDENAAECAVGIDTEGELVSINLHTGRSESFVLSDSEIDNIKKLFFEGIDLKVVKCPHDPFESAIELFFVDDNSDYGKAIQNRKIMMTIAKFRSYERWKRAYPKELLQLLSWSDDEVSETRFRHEFLGVPSPTGKKITTSFLKSMREYCNCSRATVIHVWQGFEFSVRDLIGRWGQLDPRRYLIFRMEAKKFCYKEIDALGIGSKANILVDAKSGGGNIQKSQMELYIKFLNKLGISISKAVFVTADDEFKDLGENVFCVPLEWFQLAKSIDEIDLFIQNLFKKART